MAPRLHESWGFNRALCIVNLGQSKTFACNFFGFNRALCIVNLRLHREVPFLIFGFNRALCIVNQVNQILRTVLI